MAKENTFVLVQAKWCGCEFTAGVQSYSGLPDPIFVPVSRCKVASYPTEYEAERHGSSIVSGRLETTCSYLDLCLGDFYDGLKVIEKQVRATVSTHPEEDQGYPDPPFLICGHAFVELGANETRTDPAPVRHLQPARAKRVTFFRVHHFPNGENNLFVDGHSQCRFAKPLSVHLKEARETSPLTGDEDRADFFPELPPGLGVSALHNPVREVATAAAFEQNKYTSYLDYYTPETHEVGEGHAWCNLLRRQTEEGDILHPAERNELHFRTYLTASILGGPMGIAYVDAYGPNLYFHCTEDERPGLYPFH